MYDKNSKHNERRWSRVELDVFPKEGPMASDVRQGMLGDCYFLAALSAIAEVGQRKCMEKHGKTIENRWKKPVFGGVVLPFPNFSALFRRLLRLSGPIGEPSRLGAMPNKRKAVTLAPMEAVDPSATGLDAKPLPLGVVSLRISSTSMPRTSLIPILI